MNIRNTNEPDTEFAASVTQISRGQGFGSDFERDYIVGETIKDHHGRWGVVVRACKRYFSEDGLSVGLGCPEGYMYYADLRPATEEEIAAEEARLAAREKAKAAKRARLAQVKKIAEHIKTEGEKPQRWVDAKGDRLLDTQNIYGGGDWFVVGTDWIWYVLNNGHDGDCWDWNNVRTCGAGAIGWRIPFDPTIASALREIDKEVNRMPGSTE